MLSKLTMDLTNPEEFYISFGSSAIKSFETICDELQRAMHCTYVSYALELSNLRRIHYYSNEHWQNAFINDRLIEDCPLIHFGRQNPQATILNWRDLASSMCKRHHRVMEARKTYNIGNGIGLQQWILGMKEIVTFAADTHFIDFPRQVYANISNYKKYVLQLRTIALASMLTQGWLTKSKNIINYIKFIHQSYHLQ